MTGKKHGTPVRRKGWVRPAASLGGPDPGATRRLCPGRIARALLGFIFEGVLEDRNQETSDGTAMRRSPNPQGERPQPAQNPTRRTVRRRLEASIKAVGIIQPPDRLRKEGELTIVYGARRVRFAIQIGLTEIDVLVKDPDDRDHLRAVSENVVSAPMATIDLWRSIESLACENWTEDAIASALAIPVRQIRKLRLLATVHPAILDQIGAGDMPKEPTADDRLRAARGASRGLEKV